MDDEIIYSWCFNFVECFDLTSSAAIIVLVKNLESLSSLRSQQIVHHVSNIIFSEFLLFFDLFRVLHISRQVHTRCTASKMSV